jgi:hypothetical protein
MKLTKSGKFKDFKSSYNMAKISRRIWKETRTAHEAFRTQINAFYEIGPDHSYIPATPEETKETGSMFKIKQGQMEEYFKVLNQMLDTDVDIDCHPISPDAIEVADITPQEVVALEPILALCDQQLS